LEASVRTTSPATAPAPAGVFEAPAGAAEAPAGNGRGIALMIVAMLTFASMDALSKLAMERHDVAQVLCVRFWIFLAFALVLTRRRGLRASLASRRPVFQIGRSLLLIVEMGAFMLAFRAMHLADVHAIAAVAPLIAMLMAALLLGERIGPHRKAAAAIGFLGVLVIVRPGTGVFEGAALWPLIGATLWGLYQVLVRKMAGVDPVGTTVLYTALVGVVSYSFLAPFVWTPPAPETWAMLVGVGILGAFGHATLVAALDSAPAGVLQPFGYVLPVWATVMGYLVWDHVPDRWTVAGCLLVIAGGLYALWRERRSARVPQGTGEGPGTPAG
jgi:drug/metabolite transporter (DMT)-like permease